MKGRDTTEEKFQHTYKRGYVPEPPAPEPVPEPVTELPEVNLVEAALEPERPHDEAGVS